jgi:hypothetical protein
MAYKYNIYPDAEKKLADTGLAERIKKATEKDNFPDTHFFVSKSELPEMITDMRKRGFFKGNQDFFSKTYRPTLEAYFKDQDSHKWVVKKDGKEEKENSEYEDFMLLSGYLASAVLKPREFWNFKKFRFSSAFDFFGCVGAYACGIVRPPVYDGHKWESTEGEKRFVSEVSGSEHGDFRLFRTDLTSYETLDPLGNPVSYRPELYSDRKFVSGYHSIEPGLLVALIKYADQEKIRCPLLTPGGMNEIIAELEKNGQRIGPFGDFGHDSFGPRWHFASYHVSDIPHVGEEKGSPFSIGIDSDAYYAIYVDAKGGLAFVHKSSDDKSSEVVLSIPKAEFPQLVRGLFVQAMKGLGRTSTKQLIDIVDYRHSDQFEIDKAEDSSRLSKTK